MSLVLRRPRARTISLSVLAIVGATIVACSDDAPGAPKGSENEAGVGASSPGAGGGNGTGGRSDPTAGNDGGLTDAKPGPSVPVDGEINCRVDGDSKTTLVFVNRCTRAVTYAGSDIPGGSLAPGAFACVDIGNAADPINSKRYWGWVGENPGPERHTLAEFTFNTDFNDFDWYNISHVDAHNLPMSIVPVARPKCRTLSCPQDYLTPCPEVGQVRDSSGAVVSCVSPNRDDPTNPVALLFESCDDAYAWSGDDQQGSDTSPMRACAGEDWDIIFCPPEAP